MDVREKLVKQAISHFRYGVSHDIFSEPVTTYAKLAIEALEKANGVTVQSERMVDAVPVVRCKDCAVPHNKYTGCPMLNGLVTPPDFYCPFGERKEGANNG